MHTVNRDNWRETVRQRHLTAKALALVTGKSLRAVQSYMWGQRKPSDEWIAKVGQVVAAMDEVAA